jgi:RND family efflux transporter MFP subunit
MRVLINSIVILAMVVAAGVGGFWYAGHRSIASSQPDTGGGDENVNPVANVITTQVQLGSITRKIIAYGVIAAQPADVQVLSVPYECRVVRVLAMPGQRLASETSVIEIEPSPDTQLQYKTAAAALDAAQKDFDQTQQRFSNQLATNQDLLQSQTALEAAKAKADSMQKYGAAGSQELKASGLVSKVDVQQGQVVPAGGSLVEIAAGNKIQARLGVEPSDLKSINEGDSVTIQPVTTDDPPVTGKVDLITQRINPDTSLIDVFATLPADCTLPLDGFVRGEFDIVSKPGLIVPRVAVLPTDDGVHVFIIDAKRAEDHPCKVVFENDDQAIIEGDDLDPGDEVAISGNLELADGMSAIPTEAPTDAATQPSSTAPSSQPADEGAK